ncbi:MAG TPA: F0F1 ATP synthase subunit B [Sphingomicrobium sp.]|nr:F0F1 ATP synthase subunit B [Sphingomicrobium sp.]
MVKLMLAASEVEGEHSEFVEPAVLGFLTPTVWVALAMVAVLALFLWKKVPAAVGKALDGKIAEIRAQLDEAKALRAEAESLKAEYQAKAAAADGEAAAMVERAKAESKAIVAKAKKDAEALVERRTQMAESKIAAEESAAIDEVRSVAAKAATAAATKLITERRDAKTDKALVDEAIAGL